MQDSQQSICVNRGVYGEEPWTYYPVVVVGAGASGIATGCRLRSELNFDQFRIFERQSGPGGVWWKNRYPGIACDVPSIFYSFSFMPNIDATRLFSPGADLVRYFRKVCNKYRISDKLQFDTDVSELRWLEDEQLWEVSLSYLLPGKGDLTTKEREAEIVRHGESAVVYKREKAKAKVIVSCVGGVVEPRDLTGRLPGLDSFQGPVFHSARWDPDADLENKDVVVLGAGSSASQLVPEIVKHPYNARTVTQVMRSPPWVHPKEVEPGGPEAFAKWSPWILNKAPWLGRLLRLMIFCIMELEYAQLFRTDSPEKTENNRSKVGAGYVEHMKKTVPQEYHEILTPRYAVGCKRRIFDKTWFPSLNDPKVDLVLGEISAVQPKSVTLSLYDPGRATDKAHPAKINAKVNGVATNDHISGGHLPKDSATKTSNSCTMPCDVLILANGFDIGSWIHPLCVYGRGSKSIHDVWDSRGGAQAYMGTALDGFPNFFMIFGPNTATGHSSVILACENMIEHALKFVKTIVVTREVDTYEIKEKDCRAWVGEVQRLLKGSVWTDQGAAGCGSWYVKDGWNSTAYPRSQIDFGLRCMFPTWSHWNVQYTYKGMFWNYVRNTLWYGGIIALLAGIGYSGFSRENVVDTVSSTLSFVKGILAAVLQDMSDRLQ